MPASHVATPTIQPACIAIGRCVREGLPFSIIISKLLEILRVAPTCLVISASVIHFLEFLPCEASVAVCVSFPDNAFNLCVCELVAQPLEESTELSSINFAVPFGIQDGKCTLQIGCLCLPGVSLLRVAIKCTQYITEYWNPPTKVHDSLQMGPTLASALAIQGSVLFASGECQSFLV